MPPQNDHPSPEPTCEFTNPCTTTTSSITTKTKPTTYRKVISHIFGRNKTATKLFPSTVWVHYCRKHYQRARYRSTQWPFTQCELLLDSLGRMERWGGVEGFEVMLRRREVERVDAAEHAEFVEFADGGRGGRGGRGGHGGRGGCRVLRSLRSRRGREGEEEKGKEERGNCSMGSGSGPRSTVTSLPPLPSPSVPFSSGRAQRTDDHHDHQHDNDTFSDGDDDYHTKSTRNPRPTKRTSNTKRATKTKLRKKPLISPSPVPDWLCHEVGPNKSFNDIRAIIHRLEEYLTGLREEGRKEEIRFPDIEILPSFREWVFENAAVASGSVLCGDDGGDDMRMGGEREQVYEYEGGREGQLGQRKGRMGSRVSRYGAVQKV